MTTTNPGDRATVSVFVDVPQSDAFAVFTEEIDLWWRTGPAYRIAGRDRGRLCLEPQLGGRLFETFPSRATTPPATAASAPTSPARSACGGAA
jgi:hypothetical protein